MVQLIGNFDWVSLCLPTVPWGKSTRKMQFFRKVRNIIHRVNTRRFFFLFFFPFFAFRCSNLYVISSDVVRIICWMVRNGRIPKKWFFDETVRPIEKKDSQTIKNEQWTLVVRVRECFECARVLFDRVLLIVQRMFFYWSRVPSWKGAAKGKGD